MFTSSEICSGLVPHAATLCRLFSGLGLTGCAPAQVTHVEAEASFDPIPVIAPANASAAKPLTLRFASHRASMTIALPIG